MKKYWLSLTLSLFTLIGANHAMAQQKDNTMAKDMAKATFAGGCFWCMEKPFDKLDGVISTTSGYAGGHVENPTYKQVSAGGTGHKEVLQVVYNPEKVSYDKLLEVFWENIDPFDAGGQFCDRGEQYQSAVYAHNSEQREKAQKTKENVAKKFDKEVVTPVLGFSNFYPAEEYHQDYYQKNPIRYWYYRGRCGRDDRLEELWGPKEK